MEIRSAKIEDVELIADIFLQCWKISYLGIIDESAREDMNVTAARQLWQSALASNFERKTFIGFKDGNEIGFFRVGPDKKDPSIGHLFSLYVRPEFSGKGFGQQLFSEALNFLNVSGFNLISLWVFKENTAAISLYSKFGFVPNGNEQITSQWKTLEIEMLKGMPD